MDDTVEERLDAVERAVTDGETDLSGLVADADAVARLDTLEDDFDALDERVAELEAATQALRGYVGNLRAVNREVQERADLALSTAERAVESRPEKPTAAEREPQQEEKPANCRGGAPTPESRSPARSTDSGELSQTRDAGDQRPADDDDRFSTPRTDEFASDPADLADPATANSPDTDRSATTPGLVARIRALL